MSKKTMKKARKNRQRRPAKTGLASEYRFDYRKSRPNRFASRFAKDVVAIVLDPDVAEVFRDPEQVNDLLRATIAAVDRRASRRAG